MRIVSGQAAALGLRRESGKTWNLFSFIFGRRACSGNADPATLVLPIASFGWNINATWSLGGQSWENRPFPQERATRYCRATVLQSAKERPAPKGNHLMPAVASGCFRYDSATVSGAETTCAEHRIPPVKCVNSSLAKHLPSVSMRTASAGWRLESILISLTTSDSWPIQPQTPLACPWKSLAACSSQP